MTEPLIEMRAVHKLFGDLHALDNVDLAVQPGEVVVVIGPSGSGKSTLCRCLNRLETVDAGEVIFEGTPLPQEGRELAAVRADIGMVFQSFNLFAHMTVLDNVTLGPIKVRGRGRAAAEKEAHALLERVGIGDKATSMPAQLSGGQQQRAAIARALAMQPKLMLFDEPTSALDPEYVREVLDVMKDLAKDGMTMVVVTHEMGFARSAATRVVFMDRGKLVEDAPPDQFFAAPASPRAREFLSAILSH